MSALASTVQREAVRAAWERAPAASTITVPPLLVPAVLILSLVLIQSPILFGENPPLAAYALTTAPFAAAILSLSLWRANWRASNWLMLALAYVGLLLIAALRGAYSGAITSNAAILEAAQFALLATLGMFAFLRERRAAQRVRYLRALCWAPVVYVAVNVALQAGGFVAPGQITTEGQPATMLALLGVTVSRISFPLSGGLNAIGPTAVAALVVSITFVQRGEQRTLAVLGGLLSLYVILAIDSRGALVFVVLAFAILAFIPRARKRGLGWIAIAIPILPILLVLALTGLAETSAGADLNRQGGEDIGTGTGRTIVWGEVLKVLSKPGIESVVGYGQNGQVTSGASIGYSWLFRDDVDPLSHSAHNAVLQTALDLGWLGVACLIALAAAVLSRLGAMSHDPRYAALRNAALALILLGLVQADPTPVHPDSFAFWLLVLIAATRA